MIRVNYFEPPDIDECGCSAYAKAFDWCDCFINQILEEEEELDENY